MKKVLFILIVCVLCLVGCENENSRILLTEKTVNSEFASEEMSPIEKQNNDNVLTTEEDIAKIEETQKEEISVAYQIILNDIYDKLKLDPASQQIDNIHFSTGIYEIAILCDSAEERMKSISYCFLDVNKDGIEELIIATSSCEEETMILDMYTLVEGTSVLVISGYARDRLYLLDDGMIYNEGSGGAAYSSSELFMLEPGHMELTSKGLYFTYPKDETVNDIGFYYNENSIYDVAVSTEISEEDYKAFLEDCHNRIVTMERTTFDLYK